MTELRQCKEYGEYLKGVGWSVEKHHQVQAFIRRIPLTSFSVMKVQRASIKDIDWQWLKSLCRQYRVIVNYLEINEHEIRPVGDKMLSEKKPETSIAGMSLQGYKSMKNGMLPTKTQVIKLSAPLESIKSQFKSKTRYNLGLAQRKGLIIEIKTGEEMLQHQAYQHAYLEIIRANAHRVGYWAVPDHWIKAKFTAFADKCFVVCIKAADEVVAVALFLCTESSCFYSLNGSTHKGRKVFAPTLAVWTAILEAKKRQLQHLDFDGVYDERFPNKRWLGYTRFKAGFGGEYRYYPSAYAKWLPGR